MDGKKREDGVRSFLDSRGIELPDGSPDDSGDAETVYGLGNRKNDMFQKVLDDDGVEVFDGSRRYLEAVSAAGLGIAVVSSSANTREVLEITGLDRFVQQRVDGVTLREEHITGKPAPDSYLRGARVARRRPRRGGRVRGRTVGRGRPAVPVTSASWWASTEWARPRTCAATAPTWS